MKLFLTLLCFLSFSYSSNSIINFKNLKVLDLIKISSKVLNKNILVTDNIDGTVEYISNDPINKEELLKILELSLESKGYKLVTQKNILRVVKSSDYNKLDNKVELIYLKNINAKNILNIINDIEKKLDYKNKKSKPYYSIDEDSNAIILIGQKEEVNKLKVLINKLDQDRLQVYVQARIIEVSENRTKDIGLKYGLNAGITDSKSLLSFSSNLGGEGFLLNSTLSSAISLPTDLTKGLALGATINLFKEKQAVDIVSEPSILCINNQESSIYVGETKSFQTGVVTGDTTTTNFKREDVGLTLKVKPRISNENKVTLNIETILEDAKELNSGQINPDTTKKRVKTSAIVSNGEAVIIGGLIKNKLDIIDNDVPFFSDIPVLGTLFKNKKRVNDKINLIVIVTPYIIPKSKDLSYIRTKLAQLSVLEKEYTHKLEDMLLNNKIRKGSDNLDINKDHQIRVNEILGY